MGFGDWDVKVSEEGVNFRGSGEDDQAAPGGVPDDNVVRTFATVLLRPGKACKHWRFDLPALGQHCAQRVEAARQFGP